MGSLAYKPALRCAAAVFIVAVVVPVASALGGVTQTSTIDTKLVGKWTRTVTKADVKRANALIVLVGIDCTLTIKKSGAAHLDCTGIGPGYFDGTLIPVGTNRVHVNLTDSIANLYMWRVTGRLLTFTKLKDPTQDRVATMVGAWKRK